MFITVNVKFTYPNTFVSTFSLLEDLIITTSTLEELYLKIHSLKNKYLLDIEYETGYVSCLKNIDTFKYQYCFNNLHKQKITVNPDVALSTTQILHLYDFNMYNNSQIVLYCSDNIENQFAVDYIEKEFDNLEYDFDFDGEDHVLEVLGESWDECEF